MRRGGEVVGAVITFVDITERKRAEEAVRRSEERLRLALAAGRMGTWDWDLRTNELICSEGVEALHDLPTGCFDGTFNGFRRLIHPVDRDLVDRAIARAIDRGSNYEVEYRINRPDGSIGWMSCKGQVLSDDDGRASRMIGVGMDITRRRRDEGEIFALNAELEGRLERLHALRAIDRAVTGGLDLASTLGVVVDQALGRLEVDAAAVLLCRPHEVSLEYAARKRYRVPSPAGATQRFDAGPAGRAVLEGRTQVLSGADDGPVALPGSDRAEGFVSYWALPLMVKGQVKGVLEVGHRSLLESEPEWLEFLEALAGQAAIAVDNAELFDGLRRSNLELSLAYDATIEGWSRAMDLRDHETQGHSRRVTEMTLRLARVMGIGEADLVHVRRGALLHDIGKIGIPDAILLKPGRLTDEEFAIIRRHPEYAREMLAPIAFLRPALDIPYCHHEKWDGSGYPLRLKGDQIPSVARIFATVDIWDALGSDRPYRMGLPREEVKEHLRSLAGTHLDPAVVETFLRCLEDDEAEATAAGRRDLDPGPAGDSLGGRLARAYETVRRLESEKREMVRVNARLAELCDTDDLTGLANPGRFRRSLEKAFSLSVGEGQPLSLVVLEVDQFQSHIEAHGPRSGDGVLVAVASILGGLTRPHDLGARRDGGGFAVILPSTDAAAACAIAERMRAAIAGHPWSLWPVTASFGVATITPDALSASELVEMADRALCHSRRPGCGRASFKIRRRPAVWPRALGRARTWARADRPRSVGRRWVRQRIPAFSWVRPGRGPSDRCSSGRTGWPSNRHCRPPIAPRSASSACRSGSSPPLPPSRCRSSGPDAAEPRPGIPRSLYPDLGL